ncbi:hypothetical protein [Agriterribacter sp.]|uniref:hypothetical protein n=1 Tax=Agriterribacter sp. TaxID=2821509 RepID=UPI002BA7024C|nr:hypothetical protein [Agriterribacter sp.]HRO47939.1 hypothetical protein [Agriterribacter sp.]HRQ18620.1 hypothetical protein [Agriterribacter sp.]
MAYRDQWKMLHLLNTSMRGALKETELIEMGIDCYPDTIQYLKDDGIVEMDSSGAYSLNPIVRRMLNKFMIAMGAGDMKELYVDVPSCFIVMPFSEKWSDTVFYDFIQPAVIKAKMECVRGDMITRVGKLSENIVKQIQRTGLVIADISVTNANVFYELGIADTIGRDVFLLYEKHIEQNLPADIQGAHYYAYDRNNIPESVERFAESLLQWKENYRVDITLKYCRK